MEKQKNTQMVIIAILIVSILVMSIGFAAFSTTLNLNGTATIAGSKWSIAFDPNSYAETPGSVTVPQENRTLNGTTATYKVKLDKPGDFYEFSVKVKNTGTFDAKLTAVTMSALDPLTNGKYLKYIVTYGLQTYETTTESLSIPIANTNGEETVKVKVQYIQPDNPDDLPTEPTTEVELTASLTYLQA